MPYFELQQRRIGALKAGRIAFEGIPFFGKEPGRELREGDKVELYDTEEGGIGKIGERLLPWWKSSGGTALVKNERVTVIQDVDDSAYGFVRSPEITLSMHEVNDNPLTRRRIRYIPGG